MRTFSLSKLLRSSGEVLDAALSAPVSLTKRGREALVLLSAEEYRRLSQRADDPRRVGRTAEMPEDLAREVLAAIDAFHEDANR